MGSELVWCSCEAMDGSLLPTSVEVKYVVNNKERYGQSHGQHCQGTYKEKSGFAGATDTTLLASFTPAHDGANSLSLVSQFSDPLI